MMKSGILCLTIVILVFGLAYGADDSFSSKGPHEQLTAATEIIAKAKETVLKERESMKKERSKLKDNLVEALRELNKLKGENIELTKKLKEAEEALQKLREETDNPNLQVLLDKSITSISDYLHDNIEDFDKVDALVAEVQARMDMVFGKEYSWAATLAVILLAIFFPIFIAFYIVLRVVKSISLGAYALMLEGVVFSFCAAVACLSAFTSLDPFNAFRTMSEAWFKVSQILLAVVAVLQVLILIRLALSTAVSQMKQVYLAQFIVSLFLFRDYCLRIWIPVMSDKGLPHVALPALFAYLAVSFAILATGLWGELVSRNVTAEVAEVGALIPVPSPGRPDVDGEESATKEV